MSSNFDEILGAAGGAGGKKRKQPQKRSREIEQPMQDTPSESPTKGKAASSPFAGLEPPAREPTVRLNVDVKESLNDALAAKARQYRIPKTELVRRLLEWSLKQSDE